jgi:hypothetical protein
MVWDSNHNGGGEGGGKRERERKERKIWQVKGRRGEEREREMVCVYQRCSRATGNNPLHLLLLPDTTFKI